ncbi:MAG: molybdopterin molybdotransferase MoeA [Gemmatimonadaceae bacterium]|nr:molybdopterin molybdotransferase MoeA [Gemmatimonadaceae bacterium]
MLSVAEAVARVVADVAPLDTERVPLLDALDRVLAVDAASVYTLPARDNSAMDGYAVRAADLSGASAGAPRLFRVVETVAAGQFPTRAIESGEATRIMTGAPLPLGADSVLRVEDTDGGTTDVRALNDRDCGKNVRSRGEDFREGDVVLGAGEPIGAAQIGVLASLGMAQVPVHRAPRVAILGSGDELVDLDAFDRVVAGERIIGSNSYTLHALVRAAGGIPVPLGNAPDTPESMRAIFTRAVEARPDLIISSAGISVGEFDYTRDALGSLGAELKFWKVRMRPGAPIGFGAVAGIPWIGLPGNPVSVMVTFELFARPAIRRMLGHTRLHRRAVPVTLEQPVQIGARLTHFLRAVVVAQPSGTLTARLTGPQGSGILTSMARANALLIVPEDQPSHAAGDTLKALLLTPDAQLSESFAL